jgi:hypothetical protein
MRFFVTSMALSLIAVAATSTASAQAGSQPDWVSQAKIVAQMEGISVGEAIKRGNLERKLSEAASRFESDPDYAGSYIERTNKSYKIVHLFKGPTKQGRGTGDADLDAASENLGARFSMKELRDYMGIASPLMLPIDPNAYSSFEVKANTVTIHTSKTDEIRSALSANGVIPPFVNFVSGGFFVQEQSLTSNPMSGGGPISGGTVCTAGFNVKKNTGSPVLTGVSTASHCNGLGNAATYQGGFTFGTHRGPTYLRGTTDKIGRDFTWFRHDLHTYPNKLYFGASDYIMTTVAPVNPGANVSVCLIKRNQTQVCAYTAGVVVPPGGTYSTVILDRLTDAVAGDSGGPWYYN